MPSMASFESRQMSLMMCFALTLGFLPFADSLSPAFLKMLMWNPHWQCFAWNQSNCAGHAVEALSNIFRTEDLDFATVVELGDSSYIQPAGWSVKKTSCSHDMVHQFFNNKRWRPLANATVSGCMVMNDRPFIVTAFESTNSSNDFRLVVASAHFPHPDITYTEDVNVYSQVALLGELACAIEGLVSTSGVRKVVVIADTNAWVTIPSDAILRLLRASSGDTVSTSLERTCCFDAGFPPEFTFDRVMTNFGSQMDTKVLFADDLPEWANQTQGSRRGAFHKPIIGVLNSSEMEHPKNFFVRMLTVVIVMMLISLIAFILTTLFLRWRRRRAAQRGFEEELSSDSSESHTSS